MNYEEALNYIHNTLKFGSKLGLHNISHLLNLMGNPHRKLKFVHVAGTNGKGSTVTFISSILREAGYKVGVFISPYIQRFTERIRINESEISQEDLAGITGFVKSKVDIMLQEGCNHPTEFEIVTAIAFQYYYEMKCDVVVLEVGLGGRFDSTNVISAPDAAVITTISYDHMSILGDTLPKIAFEKAGIIKENCDVVLYPQPAEVYDVIEEVCSDKGACLSQSDFSEINIIEYSVHEQRFDYKKYKDLTITMLGEHQVRNAALALDTVELLERKGYKIDEAAVRKGLSEARWPGRLEIVNREPLVMVDGAHNEEGAKALAEALHKYFPQKKKIFIFGVLKDKDYKSIVEAVAPIAYGFVTVTSNSERALNAHDLAAFVKNYCGNVRESDTIKEAMTTAVKNASSDQLICAFGSLYYIGEVRGMFLK